MRRRFRAGRPAFRRWEIPNGLGVRDTVSIGQALAGTAAVDYLNITLGTRGAYVKDAAAPEAAAKPGRHPAPRSRPAGRAGPEDP